MLLYSSAEGNLKATYGRVVELVDSLDSGSSVHCGRAGSSPASPTKRDIFPDVSFLLTFPCLDFLFIKWYSSLTRRVVRAV